MTEPPKRKLVIEQWILKAEHDLKNAQHTLEIQEDCPFDTVCFHAQQCAEKYLKSLLLGFDIDPPRSHDLPELASLFTKTVSEQMSMPDLGNLTLYAVEGRYPDLIDPAEQTRSEAEEAVRAALKVREVCRSQLRQLNLI